MIIKVLFGHRNESYSGQFAPEVLACITLTAYEESPEFFDNMVDENEEDIRQGSRSVGSMRAIKVIDIELDTKQVMAMLYPPEDNLVGKIVNK